MAAPHKAFHASAPQLQKLIGEGYEKAPDRIDALFVEFVESARSVIDNFLVIEAEAERVKSLLGDATAFTMGSISQKSTLRQASRRWGWSR